MMESPDLVAMIPVDGDWAARTMKWHHPNEKVVSRLMEKTRGRVIRSDRIPAGNTLEQPKEARDSEWKMFLKNVEWDTGPEKLWIQYTVQ